MEPVEPVLKNIYQNNTYRKDLSWPHFDDEPRVQEKQQVKEQQVKDITDSRGIKFIATPFEAKFGAVLET